MKNKRFLDCVIEAILTGISVYIVLTIAEYFGMKF